MCKFAGVFEWVFCSPIILILNVIILRVIFLTLASDEQAWWSLTHTVQTNKNNY